MYKLYCAELGIYVLSNNIYKAWMCTYFCRSFCSLDFFGGFLLLGGNNLGDGEFAVFCAHFGGGVVVCVVRAVARVVGGVCSGGDVLASRNDQK